MTEDQKSSAPIQELSYDFACRIIRLYQYLTEPISDDRIFPSSAHEREYIMSKQILRSGTSVGANVMEGQLALSERNVWACSSISERGVSRRSQHAQSDADFLSKMQIALKESNETEYWLNLLHDNGYLNDNQYTSIHNDCVRILKILNTIVRTTRNKIGK